VFQDPFTHSHPIGHQLNGQGAVVRLIGDKLRKVGQERILRMQLEAKPTALGQIVIDSRLQADMRAHDSLPGHGSGTIDSFGVSSLA